MFCKRPHQTHAVLECTCTEAEKQGCETREWQRLKWIIGLIINFMNYNITHCCDSDGVWDPIASQMSFWGLWLAVSVYNTWLVEMVWSDKYSSSYSLCLWAHMDAYHNGTTNDYAVTWMTWQSAEQLTDYLSSPQSLFFLLSFAPGLRA